MNMTTAASAFLDLTANYYNASDAGLTHEGFQFGHGLTLAQVMVYASEIESQWPENTTADEYKRDFVDDLNNYRSYIAELVSTTEEVVLTKGKKKGYFIEALEAIFA